MIRLFLVLGLAWHLARDPWIGRDKAQHLALSFIVTSAADYTLARQGRPLAYRQRVSLGLSFSLGLLKEAHDALSPGGSGFSLKDLLADAIGCALAWALYP